MANCFITGSQLLADEYESSHKKKVSKCEISSRRVMKYDYLCKCIFFFFPMGIKNWMQPIYQNILAIQ